MVFSFYLNFFLIFSVFFANLSEAQSLLDTHISDDVVSLGPITPIGHADKSREKNSFGTFSSATPLISISEFKGIPRAFINLGNSESEFGIIVEKLHHRLTVFQHNKFGKYQIVKSFTAITGKRQGNKEHRGDLRTPEGVYFATGKLTGPRLPSKYGNLAFMLDFPNVYDKKMQKTGSGIWIHSTNNPDRLKTAFDTEGCVALSNPDIAELEKYIIPFQTPVVITQEMTTAADEKELEIPRKLSLEMIEAWRKSWEDSDFNSYQSFYSKNFLTLGKKKSSWLGFKKNLSKMRRGEIQISISQPKILAFEDQLLAVFNQEYHAPGKHDVGQKFLYLQWEGDRYRIIAEKWYPTPSPAI